MTNIDPGLRSAILDGLDRYGGELSRWPDRGLAKEAAAAALADRDLRAALDGARTMDRGVAAARGALDEEIVASGAVTRVLAATQAAVAPRPLGSWRWVAAVAVIVCAAGLGSIADFRIAPLDGGAEVDVVLLDPLVFGPITNDSR
jgi:hypothetical protein